MIVDPSFGTTVMRVTDATDGGDWGNAYSYWPTFNKNNTHLLVEHYTGGVMYVQHFDATNFLLVGSRSKPRRTAVCQPGCFARMSS